jgi:hypothetical protein
MIEDREQRAYSRAWNQTLHVVTYAAVFGSAVSDNVTGAPAQAWRAVERANCDAFRLATTTLLYHAVREPSGYDWVGQKKVTIPGEVGVLLRAAWEKQTLPELIKVVNYPDGEPPTSDLLMRTCLVAVRRVADPLGGSSQPGTRDIDVRWSAVTALLSRAQMPVTRGTRQGSTRRS